MATRTALTVGEVLIVVTVVAVLVGVLLPAIDFRRTTCRPYAQCRNRQRQIANAVIAYAQDWDLSAAHLVVPVANAHEGRLETVRAFARLAESEDLRDSLFRCELDVRAGPDRTIAGLSDPIAWGGTAARHVSYAFDWSAPADAPSTRPILADRSPRHRGDAMVTYADTHVMRIRCSNAGRIGGHHTEDADGKPVGGVWSSVESPPTAEDSIYDDLGDDGDALTPGKGSATRAWVK